jgi:hypothetical protein
MTDIRKIKLKKSLCDIKNIDKSFTEKWTESRASDISNFIHPCRIAIIGPPSTGKSFLCKHLIMHQRPMFSEVYIIHGDHDCTGEYEDIEPTMMMGDFPPVDFWDSSQKTLVIIDDIEYSNLTSEQEARMNKLVRYVSSHKNVTCYFTHQNFFSLPSLVRKLCNVFIIFKPRSSSELKLIANRVGIKPPDIDYIFENICNQYRDSLCIDLTFNSPAKLRKNIWSKIKMN